MSLMIIDKHHYVPAVSYGAGTHTLTKENIGTRVRGLLRGLSGPRD